jgi:glycosyltransferase involved in cell wall biosynthesis
MMKEYGGDGSVVPTADELRRAVFAEGAPAEHPYAVLYQGEYETPADGTNVAVRKHARALAATGLPVLLKSFSHMVVTDGVAEPVHVVGLPAAVRDEVGDLRDTSAAVTIPLVKHLVVHSAERLRGVVMPRGVMHHDPKLLLAYRSAILSATVVYSVWERDRIAPEIAEILSKVAENWVPCEQNRQLLVDSGVPPERVVVVPHPYDPQADLCKLTRRKPRPERRYYSIGRWEPRKGYHELVGAFLKAFRPGEATLTIKTSAHGWDGYPTSEQSVSLWLRKDPSLRRRWPSATDGAVSGITIIRGALPPDKMLKLHFDHNIYVAPSHGEAWCLPAFDAKQAGNALVHVDYGGTADFAAPTDIRVPWKLGDVDASYGWESGAQWATYALDDLVDALRRAEPPARYERPAALERFTMGAVGAQMARRLLEVTRQADPKAAEYLQALCRVQG